MDYLEMVPVPAETDINTDLSPCHQATMLHLFGKPGALTKDCSEITNANLKAQITTHKFNNFSATGWNRAIEELQEILLEIHVRKPDLHALVGTAGMLCCRAVRGSHTNYSNHSWGCAIDLTIGGILTPQHATQIPRGLLEVYPYFHAKGWYWGAGFGDPMHMELADETIRKIVTP